MGESKIPENILRIKGRTMTKTNAETSLELIPFGIVERDRVEVCKRYGLIEKCGGIWRMTKKARDNYEPTSFVYYLRGSLEKPEGLKKESRSSVVNELFKL